MSTDSSSLSSGVDFIGLRVEWEHGDDTAEGMVISQTHSALYVMSDDGRVFEISLCSANFFDVDMVTERVESYRKTAVLMERYRDDALNGSLMSGSTEIDPDDDDEDPDDGESGPTSENGPSGMNWN